MKRRVCSRMWEAEAIADDRLDATAHASFERHAAHCEACTEELRWLARIHNATRELPAYPSQAIDRRRLRIGLLQRANERLMRGSGRRAGVWSLAAVTACALVLTVIGMRWGGTIPHAPLAPPRAPTFQIVDVNHATFTTATAAGTVQVALSDGTAAIHVEHLAYDQRFLVELPDGDLEVRGTRFQVSVVGRRTTFLEVSEGVVALRLLSQPEIVLAAGQQWTARQAVAAVAASTRSVEPLPASASTQDSSPLPPRPSRSITRVPQSPASAPPPLQAADTPAPGASVLVGDGMPVDDSYGACIRAFQSGDYAGADRLLAIFVRDNPSDARSEDAAFLRAVSHARMGDVGGAASLAHDYLQRYPTGLRHNEALRLAASGQPAGP